MRCRRVAALVRCASTSLSVARVQPVDRAAADWDVIVHDRPERDLGLAETVEIKRMLAFEGGRDGPHLLHVLVEDVGDLQAGKSSIVICTVLALVGAFTPCPIRTVLVCLTDPQPSTWDL